MTTEIIFGLHPVRELLRAGKRRAHEIFIAAGRRGSDAERLEEEAARRRVPVRVLPREELGGLVHTDKHQGVAARCDPFPYAGLEEVVGAALHHGGREGFVVVLDGITDPQNVGSIVRTSHLTGVHGIILPRDKAAPVNAAVVKASAGATEYMKIAQVTNIAETLCTLKEAGFWVTGADGASANSLYLHDFKGHHVALVFGAEGAGIRRLVKERCDYLLSIPMEGEIGSYNASVAAAIFMIEVTRQRRFSTLAKSMPKTT